MEIGDLVRYKYYPEEGGIVIQFHITKNGNWQRDHNLIIQTIDILTHSGHVLVHRNPEAFEVVKDI